jgi:site-specific recombinase XerD
VFGNDPESENSASIRDRLGVLLLLDAGIRASEIRSLHVEDVDMVERWIIVRRGKGGKLAAAQKALEHASIRTTIDIYTHLQVADVARAVEAMEAPAKSIRWRSP